jgi:uncharacterized protein YbaR (Trm112 family)
MCPVCKHRLVYKHRRVSACISAGKRGFEERTFECSTCRRTEKLSVEV